MDINPVSPQYSWPEFFLQGRPGRRFQPSFAMLLFTAQNTASVLFLQGGLWTNANNLLL